MPILAESLDGAFAVMFGVPVLAVGLTLLSFWLSARGHWSGPLLASPAVLFGSFFAYSLIIEPRKDQLMPGLWRFALVPLIVGLASIGLWLARGPLRRSGQ